MRLAEALILRADYQKRIDQLEQRLLRNAKVQEGERPTEDPQGLLEELERLTEDLVRLIQQINYTNGMALLSAGETLSDALAVRDILGRKQSIYRKLAEAASVTQARYSASEVKYQSTVQVPDIEKRADDLAQEYRELDTRIQESNWQTDLVEKA